MAMACIIKAIFTRIYNQNIILIFLFFFKQLFPNSSQPYEMVELKYSVKQLIKRLFRISCPRANFTVYAAFVKSH